ncbi:alpha/beta fold hydrolase [Corynebacterium sp. CCM 8835]|uniref:Alpha/beta fold hydrolase n=1 Tax=Corynebacterium antarcticum TaxID=2800405 RepID=A0A9Q4CAR5_9CORY|nr:alpha/beta fold hydrolase [Corynebacterium antarcticum]MCK7641730.1 alpha/beta fold hydrolase [Corynebacterium antarcticum]MCK7660174.1 alpha/beta fold hydrolase [Corynebacterium antarcticum]MCL0244959.1 alpha/beta fold hydrolase [Corynebacterium antarcticum]MCX7491332.1 alpha/beta fold hydrolase [Corynebacterium antarcticum]MCX7537351.1 alpha/beta fold hydrolase [Corynebacterium antarcticum]
MEFSWIASGSRMVAALLLAGVVSLTGGGVGAAGVPDSPVGGNGIPGPRNTDLAAARIVERTLGYPPLVPEGVNDPGCRVSPGREQAVVLVHGTDSTLYADYSLLGAELADEGWCVYGMDYGLGPGRDDGFGWRPITESAAELDATVTAALRSSGARQVSLIGFSQGATVARYWTNVIDGGERTATWIGLASPTRGGGPDGLAHVLHLIPRPFRDAVLSPALQDLLVGSTFLTELNAAGETVPGPAYVTVSTRFDEMMWRDDLQAIRGDRTRSIVLQDLCPANLGGHMFMPYNPTVVALVKYLLVDWQAGGGEGEVSCVPVPLGATILPIAVESNLGKLQGMPHNRDGVIYDTQF